MAAPNAEKLLSKFWRQDTAVIAVFGDMVFTELPARHNTWPAVRITRVGGTADDDLILDRPLLQIDVWGGPKGVAVDGAGVLRESLQLRLPYTLPGTGKLLCVDQDGFGDLRYMPDPTFDPAKPRYIFDVRLVTREA